MDSSNTKQRIFEFGEFRLDERMLHFRGERVPLQPKAIDTLVALVSRAGTVVDKADLLEQVWPDTFVVESGLQRNISVLRKTLKRHGGGGPYIETIARRGYRFLPEVVIREAEAPAILPAAVAGTAETPLAREEAGADYAAGGRKVWGVAIGVALAVLIGIAVYGSRPAVEPDPPAPFRIGLHLLHKRTPEEARQAAEWFERAIAADPKSAESHAGLAESYLMLSSMGSAQPGDLGRAREAAETAYQLDPNAALALSVMAQFKVFVDFDMARGEAMLRQAVRREPKNSLVLLHLSRVLLLKREFAEGLELIDRALAVDPVSPVLGVQKAQIYYSGGDFERALSEFRSVLGRERTDSLSHYFLALTLGFLGQFDSARTHLEQAHLRQDVLRTDRAWLDLRAGDPEPMKELWTELQPAVEEGRLPQHALALVAVSVGELDYAIEGVERAVEDHERTVWFVDTDPRLAALRTHPRYEEVIAPLGLRP